MSHGDWHIEQRHGTAAEAAANNPVLYKGEVGWETDTRRCKLGDGVTAWNDLPYASDTAADVTALEVRVDAIETTEGTYGDIVTHNASEFTTDAELAAEASTRSSADLLVRSARAGYRVGLLGASLVANNGDSTLVNNPVGGATAHGPCTVGMMTWANILLGQPFNIVINVSHGGYTSSQILGLVPDVLAATPEYVIGQDWWINDIVTGAADADDSEANIQQIIDDCNAAGATVILTDYLPVDAYTTDAMVAQHFEMCDRLNAMQSDGFMFIPVCDLIVDPAFGKPLTGMTYDGTHLSPKGARAVGEIFADRVAHLFQGRAARHPVATNVYAGSGVKGNPKELVGNPMVRGSSGGVAPLFALSGTGSPAGSKVVCADYPNLEWQRITFGGDGTAVLTPGILSGAGLTYGSYTMVPGTTRTRFGFEFRIPSVSAPGKWACVTGYQYYAPASQTFYALQDTNVAGQDQGFPADDNLIYKTQTTDALMPAGSTAIAAAIVLYGQAGAVVDVRRVTLAGVN